MSLAINLNDNNTTLIDEEPIHITDQAAAKIHELLQEEDNRKLNLRISITGGGCSGFQYEFSFDDKVTDEDIIAKKMAPDKSYEVAILMDMLSFPYLEGATVDYKNDINGERFVISNPNAKSTCGCGSSFDVA